MKKYNFLFKPFFFICSLLFAIWLVLYIEKISPSDFGRYENLFNSGIKPLEENKVQIPITKQYHFLRDTAFSSESPTGDSGLKQKLKKIFADYKTGLIDSTQLDQQLGIFLKSMRAVSRN